MNSKKNLKAVEAVHKMKMSLRDGRMGSSIGDATVERAGGVERRGGVRSGSAGSGAEYPCERDETHQSAVTSDVGAVRAHGASAGWVFGSRRKAAAGPGVDEWHNEGLGAASADQGGKIAVYAAGLQEGSEKSIKIEGYFSNGSTERTHQMCINNHKSIIR